VNTALLVEAFLRDYFDSSERGRPEWLGVSMRVDGNEVVLSKGTGMTVRVARVAVGDLSQSWSRAQAVEQLVKDIRAKLEEFLEPRDRWLSAREPFRPKGFRRWCQ
jgi:hypothetical protein